MQIRVGNKYYDLSNPEEKRYVFSTVLNPNSTYYDPQLVEWILNINAPITEDYKAWLNAQDIISNASYSGDYTQAQGQLAGLGYDMSAEEEKFLDNNIAQQNAQTERDYQTHMRDSSLLSSANQLNQLGLSPSNVIQVGGASSGVTTNAAATNMHSVASLKQQQRLNQYNQNMGIAKSIIGMVGSMASSGIYGHAIGAAKHAASSLASATAHSALNVLKNSKHPQALINKLAANGNDYMMDKLFGNQ